MYPKNAASPERISIGAVVQISDGAVQTVGVSIKVKPQANSASAGGGTTTYEEGIVEYVPTQAETNYTSFTVIAYKTGCIPVAHTVITTDSATPGTVKLAPVTHTSAVVPTVTTVTTVNGLAANVITAAATASDFGAEVADAIWDEALSGHATGGSAGAALSAATAPSAAAVADAVWDELLSGHAVSGSTGEALSAAGGSGDPWITALPGSYSAGQAGYIVGTNMNAAVSSRASQTSVDDLPTNAELATALGTADDAVLAVLGTPANGSLAADIAAIEAQTDDIGAAGAGLTALASAASVATLITYVDTEVAAIKSKTDLITASPATVADIPTATQNADALLNRDMSAVSDTNARSPLNALRFLRNKWTITGAALSVKKENDSTEAWNATVSTTPGADPVTGNDPA